MYLNDAPAIAVKFAPGAPFLREASKPPCPSRATSPPRSGPRPDPRPDPRPLSGPRPGEQLLLGQAAPRRSCSTAVRPWEAVIFILGGGAGKREADQAEVLELDFLLLG